MFEASSCSASGRSVDITMIILKSVFVTQFLGKLQTLSALKTDERAGMIPIPPFIVDRSS